MIAMPYDREMSRVPFLLRLAVVAFFAFAAPGLAGADDTIPVFMAERGIWQHRIESPYLSGTNLVEVLLPDAYANDGTTRFRVLYVLPVEPGEQRRWGDGLKVIREIGLHNRHRLICVAPTFDTTPWYGNHATDPKTRHEDHLMKVVLPLVESHYRTAEGPDGRLLLGFSKSGWGALSIMLRHGDAFGAAASWDAPLMFTEKQFGIWETGRHFGTPDSMATHLPTALLRQHAGEFQDKPRLVITGKASFGTNGDPRFPYDGPSHTEAFHELADALGVKQAFRADIKATHSWNKEWVEPVVEMLLDVSPTDHNPRQDESQ